MSDTQNQELDSNSDIYGLSDEDLMNMPSPPVQEVLEDTEEQEDEVIQDEVVDEEQESEEVEEEEELEYSEEEPATDNSVFDNEEEDGNNTEVESEEKPSKEESSKDDTTEVDYKAIYDQVFKPFKANGKEIKVRTPEEVIQLMQMGANYNKKMTGIKEQLPYLKMLERNNLLDEDKLSYAVDLLNGDKAAISKLIKDNEIELYDLNEEQGEGYAPSYKGVSKQEMELADVVEDIKESPNYERTVEVATTLWDAPSQQFIVENPGILRIIEQHISNGIFDKVWEEVEHKQSFGELQGLSSLQAYKLVGDTLNEQGTFNDTTQEQAPDTSKEKQREVINRKKQATQKPRVARTKTNNNNAIDPLSLSDEEFEKLSGAQHLM